MGFFRFLGRILKGTLRTIGWSGAIGAVAGLLTVGVTIAWLLQRLDVQDERVKYVRNEVVKLDKEIDEVKALKDEIASLLARTKVVDALDRPRTWPARFFSQLSRLRPQGVYFSSAREEGRQLHLSGYAATYADISALVGNLADLAGFSNPRITEIAAEAAPAVAGYPVRFGVVVDVKGRVGTAVDSIAGAARSPGDPK